MQIYVLYNLKRNEWVSIDIVYSVEKVEDRRNDKPYLNKYKTVTERPKADTTLSLLEILRRKASANKKYNSSWMCVGVTS